MKLRLSDWLLNRRDSSVAKESNDVNEELITELKRLEDNLVRAVKKMDKEKEPPERNQG